MGFELVGETDEGEYVGLHDGAELVGTMLVGIDVGAKVLPMVGTGVGANCGAVVGETIGFETGDIVGEPAK